MKKIIILIFVLFGIYLYDLVELNAANDYNAFQELEISGGKLLKNYTKSEYKDYYKKVSKRKFSGWRIYHVNKDIKCKFISDTVFSYYNDGKSAITYTYSLAEKSVEDISFSASGDISYTFSATKKSFKNGLQSALKLDKTYSKSTTINKEEDLKIVVEPKTVANLKIVGEGKLYNGVAASYFFWIRTRKGGFEYFIVTTKYPRLEVLPI